MKMFSDDWDNLTKVVLYGFGTVGKACIDKMKQDFHVDFMLDRNADKLGGGYGGIPIISPEEGLAALDGQKIIVMTGGRVYRELSEYLKRKGLVEFKDFCGIEAFITWHYWETKRQNCIMELHTAITMDCTLKCRNCNMFVPFYGKSVTYDIARLKAEVDRLFVYVDYVFCYVLLGGEPFLHKGIGELIDYIGTAYGSKVGKIKVITNGTVLPSPETVRILKEKNVWVSISDYTGSVPYGKRLDELRGMLEEHGVDYSVMKQDTWLSFGFPTEPANIGKEKCAAHMRECSPIFHGYNDGKVFYCHVSWSAEKIGKHALEKKDFVDLKELPVSDRHAIAEHCLGLVEDGYVSFCRLCGGCGKDNSCTVVPGEQAK